jgi:hypothetical protein
MNSRPLRMDGTPRPRRQPKRATKELPFPAEMCFVDGFKAGCAGNQNASPHNPAYTAGYSAGLASPCQRAAFRALQVFAAKHGYHRD